MKRLVTTLPLILFAVFIFGLSLVDVLTPDRGFSDLENRYLKEYKAPTLDTLLSGDFVNNYQDYLNDQFVFREDWISLKSVGETFLLSLENNNIVYGKDNYMFDKVITVDENRMNSNFEFVKTFAKEHPDSRVYFSLIPSSSTVLKDYLPKGLNFPPQLALISSLYDHLGESSLLPVNVGEVLLNTENDPLLYYRTDHHWTNRGASVAYSTFMTATGQKPKETGAFPTRQVEDFYGTFYSKAKKIGATPDTMDYDVIPFTSITVEGEAKETLHKEEQFLLRDKYAGLLWGNNGTTVITNKKAENGNNLLVIKDSYGNSLVPKFIPHYEHVVMVDLRYTADITPLLEEFQFRDIYIVYSFPNFTTDGNIIKLVPDA